MKMKFKEFIEFFALKYSLRFILDQTIKRHQLFINQRNYTLNTNCNFNVEGGLYRIHGSV